MDSDLDTSASPVQAQDFVAQAPWDFLETYWSANLWQYDTKGYVGSINLGNRFYLGDFTVDLEYMTRGVGMKSLFTDDFTLHVVPSYEWEWGRAFAKFGLENITDDYSPESMSHYLFYGTGMEFFPLKENKDIRVHAIWASNNEQFNLINIGLTWRINFKSDN